MGSFVLFDGPMEGASLPAGLRAAYDYLEGGMGFRTPGLLWSHFVQARAVRRDGGVERSARFPRPLRVDRPLRAAGGGEALPPGHYDGDMTLVLSDPGCYPAYEGGTLSPSVASFAAREPVCRATLLVERLSPLRVPPPPPRPRDAGVDALLY